MISAWGVDDGEISKASFPRIGATSAGRGLSPHSPFFTDEAMKASAPRSYSSKLRQEGLNSPTGQRAKRTAAFFKPKK